MPNIHRGSQAALFAAVLQYQATANGNGVSVDTLGFGRVTIAIIINTAAASGATIGIQDSADNAAWNATIAATSQVVGASVTSQVLLIDVDMTKRSRYLRAVISGVSGTVSITVLPVLFNPEYFPPTQANAVTSI